MTDARKRGRGPAKEGSDYIKKTGKKPEKEKESNSFFFRESLGSQEAMKAYDEYVKEHRRKLRQLEREAAGEMAPSGDWYDE